ncbi:Mu transposase C-terminal domain-containing protein, partial [Acinetobacter baumannii]
ERRALTPQGVSINAIDYYGDVLGPLVPDRDRLGKLDFRYDPRDVSRVYLHHPQTKEFVPVGRRDGSVEKITLWEHALGRRDRRSRSG